MIYFDTHVVVALHQGEMKFLSRHAIGAIDRNQDRRVSPMVVLELELLREIGRLKVPAPEIIRGLTTAIGLRVCDRPFADVVQAAAGESWTRDPFDRIIVAQARLAKAALITRDLTIHKNYRLALD